MENKLFRSSSIEKQNTPEGLHEYIKITHPGIWAFFGGCLVIIAEISQSDMINQIEEYKIQVQ